MEHAVRAAQPAAALRAMTALREELDAFERLQVARALDAGQSFGDVARALGISRQAAHRRYRDLAGIALPEGDAPAERRVVVTSEARTAVALAREEAIALDAPTVGSEHLLLGIIRSRARGVVELLESGGVTLAEARRCARPTLVVEGEAAGRPGVSPYASAVFDGALRFAVERGDAFVGVEHLLLASLEDPSGGAWRTLTELGLDPDGVRAALAA
jgi:transposase-like protein